MAFAEEVGGARDKNKMLLARRTQQTHTIGESSKSRGVLKRFAPSMEDICVCVCEAQTLLSLFTRQRLAVIDGKCCCWKLRQRSIHSDLIIYFECLNVFTKDRFSYILNPIHLATTFALLRENIQNLYCFLIYFFNYCKL